MLRKAREEVRMLGLAEWFLLCNKWGQVFLKSGLVALRKAENKAIRIQG